MFKKINVYFQNETNFKKSLGVIFLICFGYWIYLFFNSQMIIKTDPIVYEKLGKMIYETGWVQYFETGPNREPLYPSTIAVSMQLANMLSVPYQFVQKFIQIIFLFITQLLLLKVFNHLNIFNTVKLGVIFYMGVSPAIINATFSLFSEIIVFPFIILLLLFSMKAWQHVNGDNVKSVVQISIWVAITFVLLSLGKGIFQYVFLAFMIPFSTSLLYALCTHKRQLAKNNLIFLILITVIFQSFIISYKLLNKKYNGHFELTDRYVYIFLGSTIKRTNPLTPRMAFAHMATVPGNGVCRMFFTEEECYYTDWFGSVDQVKDARAELLKNVPQDQIKSESFRIAFQKIFEQPFQYLFFTFIEASKIPFWESTRIGYVHYPNWLQELFLAKWFRFGVRLSVAMMTIASLFFFNLSYLSS